MPGRRAVGRRICGTVKLITHGRAHVKRGSRTVVHRRRVCVTRVPMNKLKLVVHTGSGGFPAGHPVTDTNDGTPPPLPVGPYRPLSTPPTTVRIGGHGTAASGAQAHAASAGLSIAGTTLLLSAGLPEAGPRAQEPSVASSGRVVLYTFNWDAGYSIDGGHSFADLNPYTTFPRSAGGFCCDQVVMYDASTDRFIWVLQYSANSKGENILRVAWASPAALASAGAKAWSWVDLASATFAGAGNFLDQPRLGLSNRFLYMNVNEGGPPKGKVYRTVIIRITRAAFANPNGSIGGQFVVISPWSLRVAQHVVGPTEYFVGHLNTSSLRVVSVDDNANSLTINDLATPTIATSNWKTTTPGGDDMLLRQANSQGTAVTGVTQAGDGTLWTAWSEPRNIVDANRKLVSGAVQLAQAHIGVAVLQPANVSSSVFGQGQLMLFLSQSEYANLTYALATPDLATDAGGEVAFTVDWGGGRYYANHAVGFLSGGFFGKIDAIATSDNQPGANNKLAGDPQGDYETVRADAPPYGNCLVAAGIINQASRGNAAIAVGNPVLTIFSRPGVKCPTRFFRLPPPLNPKTTPPNNTVTARASSPRRRRARSSASNGAAK